MLFLEPEIKFEGLVLFASFNFGIVNKKKLKRRATIEDMKNASGLHYNSNGDIIVLDPYEWEMNKWRMKLFSFT